MAGTKSASDAWRKYYSSDDVVGIKVNALSGRWMSSRPELVAAIEDGLRLADRLLSLKPDLPVLLTSGYMDEEAQWIITCEKGFQFLRKPFNIRDLLRVIRDIMDSAGDNSQVNGARQHAEC